ncbi:hypothetical protein JCM10212_002556 [Sporobolomyces blumeae]
MQVDLVRVCKAFPSGPADDTLKPHDSLDHLLDLVDDDTRRDVRKMRFLGDARRCLLGRLLTRSVLADRLDLAPSSFGFDKTETGRPYATQGPLPAEPVPLDYNVSHDSDWVAVGSRPLHAGPSVHFKIGVDVMRVRNPWDGTTTREFYEGVAQQLTPRERTTFEASMLSAQDLPRILALWTLKEAYTKATGEGLHLDLSRIEFRLDGLKLDVDRAPALRASDEASETIGKGYLDGRELAGWTFDLVEFAADGQTLHPRQNETRGADSYLLAVAQQNVAGATGEVTHWRTRPDWLNQVELEDVVRCLRARTAGPSGCH